MANVIYSMQSEFSPERSMSSSDKLRIASPNRKHSLSPSDMREKQHQKVSRHVSSPTPLDKSRSTNLAFLQSGVSPTLSARLLHVERSSEFESTPTDTAAALSRSNSRLNE
jgi:hypothetical protein